MLNINQINTRRSGFVPTLKTITLTAAFLIAFNINVSAQTQNSPDKETTIKSQSDPSKSLKDRSAAESPESAPEVVSKRPFPFRGSIAKVDREKKIIELKGKKSNRKMVFTEETRMLWHGAKADLSKAKVGQVVGGSCLRLSDGSYRLVMIRFGPKDWQESEDSEDDQDSSKSN